MSAEQVQVDYHVHDVLDMLAGMKSALTLVELHQAILDKFGASARFSSCSLDGMDAKEAIDFLFSRQKLFESSPGQFQLNRGKTCGH